jgi:hypothetical protein
MSRDGPPISSGYRHGGLAALHTGLPASATALRSKPAEGELEARQTLAKFANYPERTKSIGKPLPATQGVSDGRAASLRRIEELEEAERADKSVTLVVDGDLKIKWVYRGEHKDRLIEEDSAGVGRVSITYGNMDRALIAWYSGRVRWL